MSTSTPDTEKEHQNQNNERSAESIQTPSMLADENKTIDYAGEETEADSGEYAHGLKLVLIVLGLVLGVFLVALDMVCFFRPLTRKPFL
jgi:hypothetical protein